VRLLVLVSAALYVVVFLFVPSRAGWRTPTPTHHRQQQFSSIGASFALLAYVNMDHRSDRRHEFEAEMDRHGLPFASFRRVPGRRHKLPTLGASYAWRDAFSVCASSASDDGLCCIFDDGFQFIAPYANNATKVFEFFRRLRGEAFDVIFLAGNEFLSPHNVDTIVPYNDFAWRAVDFIGSAAVCSRVEYVRDAIVPNVDEGIALHEEAFARTGSWVSAYCIDVYLTLLQTRDLWLLPLPKLGAQRPSWSNIQGAFVSNGSVPI